MDTSQPDIHIAVELPAPPARSSPSSIQTNSDGQIGVLTRTAVHILTPNIGMTYELTTADIATVPSQRKPGYEPIKLYRAQADTASYAHIAWANEAMDIAAVAPGSVSIQCKKFAWSPAGVGQGVSCLLAILTTNMEVFIFGQGKNYLDGEWPKICTLTTALLEANNRSADNGSASISPLQRVLQAQTTALAWSSAVQTLGVPPLKDLSLLALGNRGGTVTFWRYDAPDKWTRQASVVIGEEWVTHVTWSGWQQADPQTVASSLACSLSDGSVRLVFVFQKVVPGAFGEVHAVCAPTPTVYPDAREVTTLKWLELKGNARILVYAKPGLLGLVSPSNSLPWTGDRRLFVKKSSAFPHSSGLGTPAGFDYVMAKDALLVTYPDGSVHVVFHISSSPSWEAGQSGLDAPAMTNEMRKVCMSIEGSDTTDVAVMRTFGCSFVSAGVALWSYQKTYPTFLVYEPESSQVTTLVMARLTPPSEDSISLSSVGALCTFPATPILAPLRDPAASLLAIHIELVGRRDSAAVKNTLDQLTNIPMPLWVDAPRNRSVPGWIPPQTEDMLRHQLFTDLISGYDLGMLRNKLAVLTVANSLGYGLEERATFVQSLILSYVFGAYLSAIADVNSLVVANDHSFAERIIKLSHFLPVPIEGVRAVLSHLTQSLPVDMVGVEDRTAELDMDESTATRMLIPINVGEACWVCRAPVPMVSLARATCANGHVWERCSVTTLTLASPNVRTCMGCGRKAHMPRKALDGKTKMSHGWFADLLLDATQTCLLCGGRFINVL